MDYKLFEGVVRVLGFQGALSMTFTETAEEQKARRTCNKHDLRRFRGNMSVGYSSLLSPSAGALSRRHPVRGLNFICRPWEQRTVAQRANNK